MKTPEQTGSWRDERNEVRVASDLGAMVGEVLSRDDIESSEILRSAARELLYILEEVPQADLPEALEEWDVECLTVVTGMSARARTAYHEEVALKFLAGLGRPARGVMCDFGVGAETAPGDAQADDEKPSHP